MAEKKVDTFLYLKLHGSINWYYSGRDDFYGETIFYADVPPFGSDYSDQEKVLSALSGDKQTLIIPPANEKTIYFNNETVKGLWHDASVALSKATRVFVIGYSLPIFRSWYAVIFDQQSTCSRNPRLRDRHVCRSCNTLRVLVTKIANKDGFFHTIIILSKNLANIIQI